MLKPENLRDHDWQQLKPDIQNSSDLVDWYVDCTLLEQRKIELVNARLLLKRFEAYLKDKPNNAVFLSEVARYKSRVEALELAIQTLL